MAKIIDFQGFRFGNIHSSDLHLVVVSSSNRYDKNLLPDPNNYTLNVPGGDGEYYFGQTFKSRTIQVNVAFDSVDEPTFRKIAQLFACDKLQDLVFDELPYKTFKAKVSSHPDFKHICFTNRETGQRVYKGEGTLNFICYFPYAFGFNKYVVRAADYYKCMAPKDIITNSIEENPYLRRGPKKLLPGLIKDHYNVRPNMNTPWKGGYPTIEQTQWGELYFKAPPNEDEVVMPLDCISEAPNGNKLLIDVRGYWKNIPEWQTTAKLLTTPTLDYEQELMYMPQYDKTHFINMDTGTSRNSNLIGSRILVYNPGDVPVDFELRLGNLWAHFKENDDYTFRVSRHNVQRLSIEQAVDWTGLTTFNPEDNADYKYGNRYFTIEEGIDNTSPFAEIILPGNENYQIYNPTYRNLKAAHPQHAYIVEPIPREKLGHFIRLFYWQSIQLNKENPEILSIMDYEKGKDFARRYEELYEQCIYEEEKYELYWHTLKTAILDRYKDLDELTGNQIFTKDYTSEQFVYDFLYEPSEYIRIKQNEYSKYGQFELNINSYPQYITEDYLDISTKDFDKIFPINKIQDSTHNPLFLDFHERMLYNLIEPEWDNNIPEVYDNFYEYKPKKNILNDNIKKGRWFKLPPGWSMLNITIVLDEDVWGGKTWKDARRFTWGWGGDINQEDNPPKREVYDKFVQPIMEQYIKDNCPDYILSNENEAFTKDSGEKIFSNGEFTTDKLYEIERLLQFRRWYEDYLEQMKNLSNGAAAVFGEQIYKKRTELAEVHYLKTLDLYWRINFSVNPYYYNGKILFNGFTDDWWWYANNYIWANFPPIYWGYIDLINDLQIKYTPLFY